RLDMFEEMRLAAVLQAMRRHPGVLPARDVLWMATRAGARTLGLDRDVGSLEVGKKADLIIVDRARPGPILHAGVRGSRERRANDGRGRRDSGGRFRPGTGRPARSGGVGPVRG